MYLCEHWVCFACRKQFRKPARYKSASAWSKPFQTLQSKREKQDEAHPCPQCKAEMVNMGRYFKPPRHLDTQEWDNMRQLAEHGIRFASEGTVAFLRLLGGTHPNKQAVEQIIACCPCHTRTEGQRLLLKVSRKPHRRK